MNFEDESIKHQSDHSGTQNNTINEPRHEKTNVLHMQNKDADQLRGNREADQGLCICYIDCTIPLLSKSKISSF